MATTFTWHGHATWFMEIGGQRVILDPFFDDNPSCELAAEQVQADVILVSHGHFDHIADTVSIAQRTGAKVVCNFEVSQWLTSQHGLQDVVGMNPGGSLQLDFGTVKMTPAIHSSSLPDGSYGGVAGGFLIHADGKYFYFACDTALFGDMSLIGNVGLEAAFLPIGDLFTMGIEDSIAAIQLLQPRHVLPQHYNTWPPIEQDAEAWATLVSEKTEASAVVLHPGGSHEFA